MQTTLRCPCLSQQTSSAPADPGILLDLSPIKLIFLTNIVKFLETIHNAWASFQNLLTTPSTNFIWYNIGFGNDKCKWVGIEKWDISDILSSVRLLLYRQEAASLRAWHGLCCLTQYLPGRRIFDLSSVIAGYHEFRIWWTWHDLRCGTEFVFSMSNLIIFFMRSLVKKQIAWHD